MNPGQMAKKLAWLKRNQPALEAFAKGEQVQIKYCSGPSDG